MGHHPTPGNPQQMQPPQGQPAPGHVLTGGAMMPPGQLPPDNGFYMPMMPPHPSMHMMHSMSPYGYPYPYPMQVQPKKADSPIPKDNKSDEDDGDEQAEKNDSRESGKKKRVKRVTVPYRPMRRPQGSSSFVSNYPSTSEYQTLNWREQLNVRMGCWGVRGEAMSRQAEFRTQMIKRGIELDKPYEEYDYKEQMRPALKKVLIKMQKVYGWDMNTSNDVAI